jgi:hypothetical protein
VVVAVALSSVSELTLDALTVAVAVSVPGLVALTTIVIVALSPPARLPTVQVTVPPFGAAGRPGVQVPCVVDIETNTPLSGSGSRTVTPVAPVAVCPPVLV